LNSIRSLFGGTYGDVLFAVLSALLGAYSVVFLRLFSRNATTVTISLLGFPRSGKTVYLTTLFDALQRESRDGLRFVPYGRETIEEVTSNLNLLAEGVWLPRTPPGNVFFYRANAVISGPLLRRRLKIEIGDYAGERMEEMNPSSSRWLHKTDYFKYAVQSDAVMLALDTQVILSADPSEREQMQNAFVAAVQVLAEEKGATEDRKLRAPVALLFMKYDVARDRRRAELLERVPRLIEVCETRCRNFEVFYVSSTGPLDKEGAPPRHLESEGVADPLVWILRKQMLGNFPLAAARLLSRQHT